MRRVGVAAPATGAGPGFQSMPFFCKLAMMRACSMPVCWATKSLILPRMPSRSGVGAQTTRSRAMRISGSSSSASGVGRPVLSVFFSLSFFGFLSLPSPSSSSKVLPRK